MFCCWERISTIVYGVLRAATHEVPTGSWKGNTGNFVGFIGEKVITATIKVLDECLHAISGFKGTEDPLDDKLLDAPFISDCVRMKKVSSAPLYEPENSENTIDEPTSCQSGTEQWCEAIEKHMPLILHHTSAVVRAASVTCFAGITSSVYFSFPKEKQDFILSSCVRAAVNDVPSVRSAACRALGVISMFPQILDEFVHAVEINTRDPLVSVKSNAVRALGNLSRSIKYRSGSDRTVDNNGSTIKSTKPYKIPSSNYREGSQRDVSLSCHPASLGDSRWLEQVIQALISCVTTGNVKVQWNVCHALSNLFLNETLRLQDMDCILLLLLHDSSNFKIRIQAASALVPASILDYGESFPNIIQGLVHILENQGSDRIASPSNFKYRVALENQLTSTVLHVLILTSSSDHEPVKDFLVKKASFLEDWFKALCLLLGETRSSQGELEDNKSIRNPKKEIGTLIQLYNSRKHHAIEQKFEKLANSSEFSVDLHIPAVHTNPVIKFLAQPHAVPEKCCHLKATFSRGHGISEMHWQHTEDS
nr:HEAT repeat-containing protein 6 [Malus domestica]